MNTQFSSRKSEQGSVDLVFIIIVLVVLIIIGLLVYAVGDPHQPTVMDSSNPVNTFWNWLTSPDGAGIATK